jgi:hypothetical protein
VTIHDSIHEIIVHFSDYCQLCILTISLAKIGQWAWDGNGMGIGHNGYGIGDWRRENDEGEGK